MNLIIRKSREAKEKYFEEMCSEIETLIKTGSIDEVYRMVKMFFGQHKPLAGGIEDSNGRMLYGQNDRAKRWKEYLEILYKGETLRENETNQSSEEDKSDEDNEIAPIMRKRVRKSFAKCEK